MSSPDVNETNGGNASSKNDEELPALDGCPPEPTGLTNDEGLADPSMEYSQTIPITRRKTVPTDLTGMLEHDDMSDAGCCYRLLRKCPRLYKGLLRWPRTSAIVLGVGFPMLFLVLVSIVFGSILASFEAPLEIQQNDSNLAHSTLELAVVRSVINITTFVPQICLAMYFNGMDLASLRTRLQEFVLLGPNATFPSFFGEYVSPGVMVTTNSSDMFAFMNKCGNAAGPIVERLFRNTSTVFTKSTFDSLTFNWIRCYPGANGLGGQPSEPASIEQFQYDAQYAWYVETWRTSQEQLYDTFLQQNLEANMSLGEAKEQAKRSSFNEATGIDGCEVNAPASGWWWFIMLSTVGYGNYVPDTSSGRVMVMTLGFLSILAFAGILAVAGMIFSAIFDDCLVRLRFKALTHPSVAMVVWGSLYYAWMAVIMSVVVKWMQVRVDDTTFDGNDGFWFAFVSSTTIGFGDIYLPPTVFLYRDLLTFPLMWLVSFVLVAAFIAKFADTWVAFFGRRSYIVDVLERLHKTYMLHDLPSARELVSEHWKKRFATCCPRCEDHESDKGNVVAGQPQSSNEPVVSEGIDRH